MPPDPAPSPADSPEPRWLLPLLLSVILLCYALPMHSWQRYRNVNESVRIYLVDAAVREHHLYIDSQIAQYGDLQDKAKGGGHFYSDKPIGLSLIAAAPYAGAVALEHAGVPRLPLQGARYYLTLICVSLPSVLAAGLLYRYWRRAGIGWRLAAFGLLSYSLGTIAFTYSTQFVGHQLAADLAVFHFTLSRSFRGKTPAGALLLAGALAGLGALTDYFSAFIHLFIGLSYLTTVRPIWRHAWTGLGALLALAPLALYNWLAFGSPLSMGYANEATAVFQTLHSTGFLGVTYPRAESAYGLLFSLRKGLLILSPFLALAPIGAITDIIDRTRTRDVLVCTASVIAIGYLAMSVHDWLAGWTIGPRHMVSMLPFLVTLTLFAADRIRILAALLIPFAVAGILLNLMAAYTLPAFDVNFENPLADQAAFLLSRGLLSPTIASALGLGPLAGLCLAALAISGGGALTTLALKRPVTLRDSIPFSLACLGAVWFLTTILTARPQERWHAAYFQGRTLEGIDRPRDAAELYTLAFANRPDPDVLSPHLAPDVATLLISSWEAGDIPTARAAASLLHQIDPNNPDVARADAMLQQPNPPTTPPWKSR